MMKGRLARALALATSICVIQSAAARAQSSPVTYVYDDLGRLVGVVDGSGESAVYVYDAVGNLLSIERHSAGTVAILAFTPASGPIGSTVTILGTGFSATPSQNSLTFNGVAATITSSTATQIVAVVPNGATTGALAITTPSGSATSSTPFTVTASSAPTISSFTPSIGTSGTTVTINGTNFDTTPANNRVLLNTSLAQVSQATASTIDTAVMAGGTSGRISVKTPKGSAVSSADFFVPPPPFSASDVQVTDRATIGVAKAISITTSNKIGLVLFDGLRGQRVVLNVSSVTIGWGRVSIQNPDGTLLIAPTAMGTGGAFFDTQTLPATGTYTILVDPDGSYTGNMTLTLYNVAADVSGTITAGGAPVSVTTTTPGQNATVTFSGTAQQRISLQISGVSIPWTMVSIKKPDGSVLVAPFGMGTSGAFIDTQTLPAKGTYTILIDPSSMNTGSLTLTMYDVPADMSGTITAGGAPASVTTTTPGQNATLTFAGTVQQRISVRVTGVSIPWTTVSIKKPDGSVLASAGMGTSGAFFDTMTLPTTGTYTILVDPNLANTGSMTLTMYDVPADVSGTITAGGSPVSVTTTTPGQNATLTFAGTAQQRISVRVTGVSIPWTTVSIKKPDGSGLASAGMGTSGGFFDTMTLPATGTYTILVDPEASNTGSMTLTVYDVPADATGSLTIGGAAVPVSISIPGQNGALTFSGTQGQQVTVRITSNTAGWTTVKLLQGGTTLTSSSSGSSSFNLATQTLPATTTYTVVVDPSQWNTGSLNVNVTSP